MTKHGYNFNFRFEKFRFCNENCLDKRKVEGKVVLCNMYGGIKEALSAGAVGSVVPIIDFLDVSFVVPFPASSLSDLSFSDVHGYFNSTK